MFAARIEAVDAIRAGPLAFSPTDCEVASRQGSVMRPSWT